MRISRTTKTHFGSNVNAIGELREAHVAIYKTVAEQVTVTGYDGAFNQLQPRKA